MLISSSIFDIEAVLTDCLSRSQTFPLSLTQKFGVCLFSHQFFDVQTAYYHSGGWRINPNLYEEGKVCLSLLNTWTGKGNEVWDPKSSSILQVLVSLQGLVLNSKPYFNEAGYDKQIGTAEGEKNSLSYNENTFLLNCKTMMYLMRKLPKVIYHIRYSVLLFLSFVC